MPKLTLKHYNRNCNTEKKIVILLLASIKLLGSNLIIYPPTPFPSVFGLQLIHLVFFLPINSFWWDFKKGAAL